MEGRILYQFIEKIFFFSEKFFCFLYIICQIPSIPSIPSIDVYLNGIFYIYYTKLTIFRWFTTMDGRYGG